LSCCLRLRLLNGGLKGLRHFSPAEIYTMFQATRRFMFAPHLCVYVPPSLHCSVPDPRNVLKNTAYFPDLPPVFRVNHDKPHPAPPLATLKSEAPLYLLSVTFDGLYGSTIAG
jgi:hypothetical protein